MKRPFILFILIIILNCFVGYVLFNLPHQIVTGLNPYVLSVFISLLTLLIVLILWLSLKLKQKLFRTIAYLSLLIAIVIPPIIQSQRMKKEFGLEGVPRRYYQLPDTSEAK